MTRVFPRLASLRSLLFFSPFASLFVLHPGVAVAQQPRNVDPMEMMRRLQDPAAMQEMARKAEAAQKCMKDVDRAQLDALQKRAQETAREIERLCEAGRKNEALEKGVALAREMQGNATVQKVRECAEDMADMVREMGLAEIPGVEDEPEPTKDDICS